MKNVKAVTDDFSIVLCGAAGLGIQTISELLTKIVNDSGYNVFSTQEYMSRVRGGLNSVAIRIAAYPVKAYIDRIDIFFTFSKGAIEKHKKRITNKTVIIGEKDFISEASSEKKSQLIEVALTEEAVKLGNKIYANSIAAGIIACILKIDLTLIENYFKKIFSTKGQDVIQKNFEAVKIGYQIAKQIIDSSKIIFEIKKDMQLKNQLLFSGIEAVSLGALAGGCNFICSYPMSPASGVFNFLAEQQKDFDVIFEQAEDEIAAINAAFGAWYAGARGLVTTSGGGFALMEEGVSLVGAAEMPMVIHIGQRPGPATGLPTRTEQADLNLALYSGHGEFPRIIFAPGNIEQSFYLSQKAFNLADKYQIPIFILTDQYLLESYYNLNPFDISNLKIEKHIVKTEKNYKRYLFTETGISPRGIPGGKGLIVVDGHEHDEDGHISEDLDFIRKKMVEKRNKKMDLIKHECILPELIGKEYSKYLVICWGSNYELVKEAIQLLDKHSVSCLHFSQVYPLHPKTKDYLLRAKKIILVENNYSAQFGELLKLTTGVECHHKILKFTGMQFSVEELYTEILSIVKE